VPGSAGTPTTGTFSGTHVYTDDGTFLVTVHLTDEAGTSGQATLQAVVNNLAPTVGAFGPNWYITGRPYILTDTFNDPGKGDTHSVTVGWGDGTASRIDANSIYYVDNTAEHPSVVEPTATGAGQFTIGHVYNDDLDHLVVVTVTDDSGAQAVRQLLLTENA